MAIGGKRTIKSSVIRIYKAGFSGSAFFLGCLFSLTLLSNPKCELFCEHSERIYTERSRSTLSLSKEPSNNFLCLILSGVEGLCEIYPEPVRLRSR